MDIGMHSVRVNKHILVQRIKMNLPYEVYLYSHFHVQDRF